ncbi:MAG: alpha-L-rhamnosidase C-terminal domain-containing protein [Candidatus Acidiferrum sp.]
MRKLIFVLVVVFVWMGAVSARADAPDSEGKNWKAEWITAEGVAQRDEVVLHFRKVIELVAAPGHFFVDVSADNQFVFYVNGKRVGTGPSRGDLAHWRYETFDLGAFLHAGKNVLGATVWNFGVHAAVAQMTNRTGFLVHGKSKAERAADTDASWEVEEEKGIATMRPEAGGFYFAAGPGERWDAAKIDWDREGSAGGWTKGVTLGHGSMREERDAPNNWQLVADPLPAMEMKEVPSGRVVRATGVAMPAGFPAKGFEVAGHTKASILVDRGELVTAYPALTVSAGAGSKIRVTYSEALYDEKGEKGNRDEIAGKHIVGIADEFVAGGPSQAAGNPGTQAGVPVPRTFMPLAWRTWRYLQIDVETGEQPIKIEGLQTWFTAYPFEEKGYFRGDDGMTGKIWEIGWRTARLDAHDTYMDTPYWERLQYIGDTRIQALISYAVAGDDRLARQAMEAFNDSRVPDGLTQSRYPSELVQMIPTFSLLWVGMVHDFWMYRGDADFVRQELPGTRTVLDWFVRRQRADGLLGKIAWWPFVDWGKDFDFGEPEQEADGESSILTLQFVEALRYAAELEDLYGDRHLAEEYRAAAGRAAAGVLKLCWDDQYGLLADTPAKNHFSQHANILGVWLDVIPKERQKRVMEEILIASEAPGQKSWPQYHLQYDQYEAIPKMTLATYYFRFYLARAVEHVGMGDWYLELLRPWREMVKLGLSTWAESPEPTRSDSHAWSAHPNFDLLTIVAGIRPESAGFGKVRIAPHLAGLTRVEAGMPTPRGMVEVRFTNGAQGLAGEVTLPAGVSGELEWGGKVVALHGGEQKVGMK